MPAPVPALVLALATLLASPLRAHTPHDVVRTLAVSPDFASDQTLLATFLLSEHDVFARSVDGGLTWQEYGLELVQSQVLDLVLSPDFGTDGTAFAATSGGFWRSTDGGITWEAANTGLTTLDLREVAVADDFATTGRLLLATGDGCFRSDDGGQSWSPVNAGLTETEINVVAFAPGNSEVAFAGGQNLHRSNSGGLTWAPRSAFGVILRDLEVSPSFARDLTVAVTHSNAGVLVSETAGFSFAPSNAGLSDLSVNDVEFTPAGELFAATRTDGCFRAPGPFQPWTLLIDGLEALSDQTTNHWKKLALSPDFESDGVVFLGAWEGLFRSDDGAATWRQQDIYGQRINRSMAVSPDYAHDRTVILGNYGGGVYLSTDGGQTFTTGGGPPPAGELIDSPAGSDESPGHVLTGPSHLGGLAAEPVDAFEPWFGVGWDARADGIASLYPGPVAVSPDFDLDDTLFMGHVGMWRSVDRGHTWERLTLPPGVVVVRGMQLSPAFLTDRSVIFGTAKQGVWMSQDAGDTWFAADAGLPADTRSRDFAFSPRYAADGTIFFSTRSHGVFKTTDRGLSWVEVNNGITALTGREIAISPNYAVDGTVFVGSAEGGLFITRDRGASWTASNAGIPDLDGIDVEGIAVSPSYRVDQTVFISTQRAGIWRSTDRGVSWTPLHDGLPPDMPRTMEISPAFADDRTVFLSTHDWIWRTTDAGETWKPMPGYVRVADNHPQVSYTPAWPGMETPASHGAGVLTSPGPGSRITFAFRGDSITWFAVRDGMSGIVRVLLDGQVVAAVDLYADEVQYQQPVWSMEFDEVGPHEVTILTTGSANPASGGTAALTDGFAYTF